VLSLTPIYNWAASMDPESDVISYEIEVSENGAVIASATVLGGTVASMSGQLENGKTYTWRARAVDSGGAMSEFSAENTFKVDAPIDTPDVVVNGGGCQTGGQPGAGLLLAVVVGLVLRRRRRDSK
jgi:MYXO-CTERM domain-containing protein